jgi:large subunit ribosomal protein L32e
MSKDFKRYQCHKVIKLSTSWRKQRGIHNKVREARKGNAWPVRIGYGTAKDKPACVVVSNIHELEALGKKGAKEIIVVFSSGLGVRKRLSLLSVAKKFGVSISNVKPDFEENVRKKAEMRKAERLEKDKKKEGKQKELDKKAKEKAKEQPLEEKLSDKDKKEQEKKEMDKVLTRKEGM